MEFFLDLLSSMPKTLSSADDTSPNFSKNYKKVKMLLKKK